MPEDSLSDIGDVLAARFADIGIDPESSEPLNLPSAEPTKSTDADLIAQVVAEDDAPAPVTHPTTAPVAAPATAPAAPVPPTAGPPSVMAYLKDKYGEDFSAKYQSDEAFLQGVLNLNKRIGQRDEDAQLGRVLKDQPDVAIRFLQQQRPDLFPQPQAPTPQPAPAQAPADASQFSPEWIASLQLKEGADPRVKQDIAKWLTNQQLVASPIGQELAQTKAQIAELKQMLAQGVNQPQGPDVRAELAAFQQGQAAKEFINANESWLFTNTNGVRVLSPEGFVYKQALESAHQGGMPFETAKEFADAKLALHRAKAAPKPNGATTPTTNAAAARQPAPATPQADGSYDYFREGEDLEAALTRNLKHFGYYDALQSNF
jgi:hypothetical protein